MEVRLDRVIDIVEPFRHQRRTGRQHHAHARKAMGVARAQFGLAQRIEIFGGGAEHIHPLGIGVVEQDVGTGMESEPSYWRIVAPLARPLTSQFHIIQPSVVK